MGAISCLHAGVFETVVCTFAIAELKLCGAVMLASISTGLLSPTAILRASAVALYTPLASPPSTLMLDMPYEGPLPTMPSPASHKTTVTVCTAVQEHQAFTQPSPYHITGGCPANTMFHFLLL